MPRLVSVAVPVPFLTALTYRVPAGAAVPAPGVRVRVPLGGRQVTGCVLGAARTVEPGDVKDLLDCLDAEPFLPQPVLDLAAWVAEYYGCGPGDAVGAAMPPFAWTQSAGGPRTAPFKTERAARLTDEGRRTFAAGAALGAKQRAALALLAAAPGGLTTAELAGRGIAAATLRRLEARDLIAIERRRVDRDPAADSRWSAGRGAAAPVVLTREQEAALASLSDWAAAATFRVALLHGVTGSGKTAVYVELAAQVLRQGRRVLVLVPEIALTPAVTAAFRAAAGSRVAVQHSGLSDGERHDQWHRIRRGEVDVVVGTRSAVFAPLDDLGLIVVDEEQDGSYKQEESPRYHGRDVAIMRGQQTGALVVLGSATPSLETYHNTARGRFERLVLSRRVLDRPLAAVTIVDMRRVDRLVAVSPAYADILRARLAAARVVAIPNAVDATALDQAKTPGARFNLGLLGAVPKRKRLDLALDLVTEVRRRDERYRLFVKSEMPWDRPLWGRSEERDYFRGVLRRVRRDRLLRGAVVLEPFGRDVADWLRKIGTVLSTSDRESFHVSVAEGMMSRATAVVLPWRAAEAVYGEPWVVADIAHGAERVLAQADPHVWERRRQAARARVAPYALDRVFQMWANLIVEDRDPQTWEDSTGRAR